MDYITAKQPHFPGALTDDAVALFRTIKADWMYIPDARSMSKAQLDALHLLVKSGYIVSAGWYGFRARGTERGWTGYAAPAMPYGRADIECITVCQSPANLIVRLNSGQWHKHTPAEDCYAALVALAKTLSEPHALRGRAGVYAYGNVGRLLGKHAKAG